MNKEQASPDKSKETKTAFGATCKKEKAITW